MAIAAASIPFTAWLQGMIGILTLIAVIVASIMLAARFGTRGRPRHVWALRLGLSRIGAGVAVLRRGPVSGSNHLEDAAGADERGVPSFDFDDREIWAGGDYGLMIAWRHHDFAALDRAYTAALSHSAMSGPLAEEARDASRTELLVRPRESGPDEVFAAWGGGMLSIVLPTGQPSPCRISAAADESDGQWLDLGIPLAGLELSYDVGEFPGGYASPGEHEEWRRPVDELLIEIARVIFARAGFDLAIVGFTEGLGDILADSDQRGLPDFSFEGYLVPDGGKLEWHPPTHYDSYPPPDRYGLASISSDAAEGDAAVHADSPNVEAADVLPPSLDARAALNRARSNLVRGGGNGGWLALQSLHKALDGAGNDPDFLEELRSTASEVAGAYPSLVHEADEVVTVARQRVSIGADERSVPSLFDFEDREIWAGDELLTGDVVAAIRRVVGQVFVGANLSSYQTCSLKFESVSFFCAAFGADFALSAKLDPPEVSQPRAWLGGLQPEEAGFMADIQRAAAGEEPVEAVFLAFLDLTDLTLQGIAFRLGGGRYLEASNAADEIALSFRPVLSDYYYEVAPAPK